MQTLFASLLAVVTMAINAQSWKTTLPDMLFGMIGIFIVIGVIILVTYGLNKPKGARQVRALFLYKKQGCKMRRSIV